MLLSQQLVKSLFDYDDGRLRWRIRPATHILKGDIAGSHSQNRYIQVVWKGQTYVLHKLIFIYHHGWMPEVVDHIDGNTKNNRIENLRAATKTQNQHNRRANCRSTSGIKNVVKHRNKWQVSIKKNGRAHYIGTFSDLDAAAKAAVNAREALHGKFARHV